MDLQIILSILFIIGGIFFMMVGSIGILRLPDFYSRTHAASKSDTLGIIFVIGGLIIFEGFTITALKLVLIVLFVSLANPIGTHALAMAALKKGIEPLLTSQSKNGDKK